MTRESRSLKHAGSCMFSAVVLVTLGASVLAQESSKTKKFLTKPLVIEDQGSFFIGGVPKVTNYATVPPPNSPNQANAPNQITIGQMYVQFQIPSRKKRNMPPVIMVHGSSHTAACLESTPDGREGWAPYFVRQGISTYIVDQAGRGRSGFDESVIHEAAAMIRNGDVVNGTAHDSRLRPDHRQWRLDRLVRASDPDRLDDPHGYAHPARRPGRPTGRRRESHRRLLAGVSPSEPSTRISSRAAGPSRSRPPDPTTTMLSSTTSSWFPTRRSRCRAPPAPPAIRWRSLPPIPGLRRIWRCWSKSSAARSSRHTHSRESWGITWPAS